MALKKLKETESGAVKMVPALTVAEDHWLLLQNENPKNVMGKWLVVLMGPSPKLAQWVLMSGSQQSLESLWRFENRRARLDAGSWLFYGRKPEYRDGRWTFVSERPELFFAQNGKVLGKRITTTPSGDLVVADNSEGSFKSLTALNEKQVSKVLVGIHTNEDKATPRAPAQVVVTDSDDEFQKLEIQNDNSLAVQFKDRLHQKISQSSDGGGNPLFHPVEQPKEKALLLDEGIKSKAKTEIWSKDRKHRVDGQMTSYSMESNFLTTSVPPGQVHQFLEILRGLNDVTCLFSVNLKQVQLFFVSSLQAFNKSAFQFEIPDKLFEVQRRYSLRYTFGTETQYYVEFDHPRQLGERASRSIIDISGGGLALMADPIDKELFAAGQDLKHMTFTLGGREITVVGHIRHCTPVFVNGQETYLKVGISFKRLKPRDANHINLYVYEQSLRFLSTLRS